MILDPSMVYSEKLVKLLDKIPSDIHANIFITMSLSFDSTRECDIGQYIFKKQVSRENI